MDLVRITQNPCLGKNLRLAQLDDVTVGSYEFQGPQTIHCHSHEQACLAFLVRGRFREQVGRKWRESTAGTFTYLPPGSPHCDEIGEDRLTVMSIDTRHAGAIVRQAISELTEVRQFHGGMVVQLARQIYVELCLHGRDSSSTLALSGLVLELLAALLRSDAPPRHESAPHWLTCIVEKLNDSFATPHSLAELAKEAGVHPLHLPRAFRRHVGCSVGTFIRRRRLNFARVQLTRTELPLATIASEAGFSDQAQFTRLFRQQFNVTPGKYRKTLATG